MKKIQAPAVHSSKLAMKHALKIKSFMEEKIAGGQLQSEKVKQIREQQLIERQKIAEEKIKTEEKKSKEKAKAKKEDATNSLAGLIGK